MTDTSLKGSPLPNRETKLFSQLPRNPCSPPNCPVFSMPVQTNLVVEQNEHSLEIKIENTSLLNDLALKFGYDRTKVACALIIVNNNISAAYELLKKSVDS